MTSIALIIIAILMAVLVIDTERPGFAVRAADLLKGSDHEVQKQAELDRGRG